MLLLFPFLMSKVVCKEEKRNVNSEKTRGIDVKTERGKPV